MKYLILTVVFILGIGLQSSFAVSQYVRKRNASKHSGLEKTGTEKTTNKDCLKK